MVYVYLDVFISKNIGRRATELSAAVENLSAHMYMSIYAYSKIYMRAYIDMCAYVNVCLPGWCCLQKHLTKSDQFVDGCRSAHRLSCGLAHGGVPP